MIAAERRLLRHLAQADGWVALAALKRRRLHDDGTGLLVPHLMARGLIDYRADRQELRITAAGRAAMERSAHPTT
ncbi:hypothetical protein [Methylobacterium nodulans]|uniref:Uncharacterized protein n=1 Tax=Methylobacterium nodulans (strain LMG 21967 / CNCM I-2342 / ORS 2060) TaxID=460265 RepID=B8IM53_METNO|nr:hypothetical protein [Methylobacterium nodulans]ACL56397.1 conserved hypothetical protein [Methylobacterium nodulans ORS 2060]